MRPIPFFGVCLAIFTTSTALGQHVYHVAPPAAGGSDTNPGTQAAPFATLQRAANLVTAGDTVRVRPGVYAGFNLGEPHSGTPGAPISFIADPGVIVNTEAARFNGQTHHARINMDTVSNIVIDGFEVVGTNDQRNSKAGVRMVAPADTLPGVAGSIIVRNCHIHHNGQWGVFSGHVHAITVENCDIHDTYEQHGIYLSNSGDNHVVRGNRVHDNSAAGFHCNADASQGGDGIITGVVVENNLMWNNGAGSTYIDGSGVTRTTTGGGSAINCDGVRDSVIRNNALWNNHASGVSLYRIDGLLPSSNNVVVNNTIVNGSTANTNARWCLNISDGSTGAVVFNNILLNYHPFRGSIIITADSLPSFVSDFNIVMDRLDPDGDGPTPNLTLAQWRTATGQDAHSVAAASSTWNSLFVDLSTGNLHPTPGSIAIDAGTMSLGGRSAPSSDMDLHPRPAGPAMDIGAYEFTAACDADFNHDGAVTSQDFFDFLGAFFQGVASADINHDGAVTSQDFFEFLPAFFTGC